LITHTIYFSWPIFRGDDSVQKAAMYVFTPSSRKSVTRRGFIKTRNIRLVRYSMRTTMTDITSSSIPVWDSVTSRITVISGSHFFVLTISLQKSANISSLLASRLRSSLISEGKCFSLDADTIHGNRRNRIFPPYRLSSKNSREETLVALI
jgi:hypothetical protein